MAMKPMVEVKLMERADKTQYFEIWVRSGIHRKGTIVERDFQERMKVGIQAGALAEDVAESFNDSDIDPSECSHRAIEAYLEINLNNPRPMFGDERALR